MDPVKLTGITKWPRPNTVKEIQSFLDFCNFYRHFICNFLEIAYPLHELTKKVTPFKWTNTQESAFRALIHTFTQAPVLALSNMSQPFCIITDISDFAFKAILEQPDLLNCWHPVACYSKSMQSAKLNYDIHDKELLAIIRALESFHHYLEENPLPFEV